MIKTINLKMVRYYCPYCNPKYQFQKQSLKGNLICGLCGEDLVKKPYIKVNQIIALVAASSLLLPLIYTFIFLLKLTTYINHGSLLLTTFKLMLTKIN